MPRNFVSKVLGHDDSDHEHTDIVDGKVPVQVLLNMDPVRHKQPQFGLFARF